MNRRTVRVRNVVLGEGVPKICVPIVAETREEILAEAISYDSIPVDVVEWRIDWYDQVFDMEAVKGTLSALREILGETPILVTFRTSKEGGEKAIDPQRYAELYREIAATGDADLIDVEIFIGDQVAAELIQTAHEAGVKVVASNHDFDGTPDKEEIVGRLRKMQELGADVPKIAVMPTCPKDVLTLLEAANEMAESYADRPVITMSMGGMGLISRLCGEVFGSALTFGAAKKASAPGQMAVKDLSRVLELIHKGL